MKWILHPKQSEEYRNGAKNFVTNAFSNFGVGNEVQCPCKDCSNRFWYSIDDMYNHLVCKGPYPSFVDWIYEILTSKYQKKSDQGSDRGLGLGNDFDEMMDNAYKYNDDCRGFIVKLYQLKCIHSFTESSFTAILELIKDTFPEVNLPSSFNTAKNMIKELGLDYQKNHACTNDCMLYWAENINEVKCKVCGISRWKIMDNDTRDVDTSSTGKKYNIPSKVMRYFPLKPRLQRVFMCKEYAEIMKWHDVGRIKDGKLRHPGDAEAWKSLDARYPDFAVENRNVRLGLAADGFSPY
ncbi:uncharacterized protein LOC141692230 [Apium graveolens]|uniref:uncharacterized protein LOC141692230 n=1 Tax=Apium graveolens TaxID=4045 RepID=UPI003D7BDADD